VTDHLRCSAVHAEWEYGEGAQHPEIWEIPPSVCNGLLGVRVINGAVRLACTKCAATYSLHCLFGGGDEGRIGQSLIRVGQDMVSMARAAGQNKGDI